MSEEEGKEFISKVEDLASRTGFSLSVLKLPDMTSGVLRKKLREFEEKPTLLSTGEMTATKWEDLLARKRMEVLCDFASTNGHTRLALGDSATRLATHVIAETAKGRSINSRRLKLTSSIKHQGRSISLVRPGCDFLSEEIFFFLHVEQVSPVSFPLRLFWQSSRWSSSSLNSLSRRFILTLQADKKGSVHTILRTVQKLECSQEEETVEDVEGEMGEAVGQEEDVSRTRSLLCEICNESKASVKRPKDGSKVCKTCFFHVFEDEIHKTIIEGNLFRRGEKVCVAASGGKDSTVLAEVMTTLNRRHDYGLQLFLLSIDEGIAGYRDDSLETVKRNQVQYDLPLKILSYQDLYGWSMDSIVSHIGRKGNCTFCGVFRRQALDRGASILEADKIVTGHNADDIAETVLLNILRGDVPRLQRCTQISTGMDGNLPRSKPFKHAYEKEIVMYAHFKKLDYFSTECIYSPNAYRGFAREFLKDLERADPTTVLNIIRSGEMVSARETFRMPSQGKCERCGYISSQRLCKACLLLDDLDAKRKAAMIAYET